MVEVTFSRYKLSYSTHKIIIFLTMNYPSANSAEYDPKRLKIYIFTLSIKKTFSKQSDKRERSPNAMEARYGWSQAQSKK
jgi:hypothetical protein